MTLATLNRTSPTDALAAAASAAPIYRAQPGRSPLIAATYLAPDGDPGAGDPGAGNGNPAGGGSQAGGNPAGGGDPNTGDPPALIPKNQYDAVLNESIARRKELAELKKQLEALKASAPSSQELEELREFRVKQQKEAEQRLIEEGKLKDILASTKAKAAEREAELQRKIEELAQMRDRERIDYVIASILPTYTSAPISDVAPMLRGSFKVENGVVQPVGADGTHPLNPENGKPMTPEDFIAGFIAQRPYLAAARPKGGSGMNPASGRGGSSAAPRFTADQISRMSHDEFLKHERELTAIASGRPVPAPAGADN